MTKDRAAHVEREAVAQWAVSLVLARYCYGDEAWRSLDPEERNAIAEPYLPRARELAPMLLAALPQTGDAAAVLAAFDAAVSDTTTWCGPFGYPGVGAYIDRRDQFIREQIDAALTAGADQ